MGLILVPPGGGVSGPCVSLKKSVLNARESSRLTSTSPRFLPPPYDGKLSLQVRHLLCTSPKCAAMRSTAPKARFLMMLKGHSARAAAVLCCAILALSAAPAGASPWAEPGDAQLRSDIEVLAAAGMID